jgi:adenosylcobinamide kinase / adenosylcobinamide-phosphate guanylyltransferase
MGGLILITGGSRSGKSDYALRLGLSLPGPRAFVATCPLLDEEMRQRIKRHQESRDASEWVTIEETTRLAEVLHGHAEFKVFLVDCITLWVNNLMYRAHEEGRGMAEEEAVEQCSRVLDVVSSIPSTVICVTNEVGWGIVPDNPHARLYRDLVGRCNQVMAEAAEQVILVSCGIPMMLKERRSE